MMRSKNVFEVMFGPYPTGFGLSSLTLAQRVEKKMRNVLPDGRFLSAISEHIFVKYR